MKMEKKVLKNEAAAGQPKPAENPTAESTAKVHA
jgi:hypothetical protein